MAYVTVIIPSYNCGQYVSQAVMSVLRQTFTDYEIILVDDGSSDNTSEVLAQFMSNPRFRYYKQANRGLPGARNSGVRISSSEYIAFLDADDELDEEALELMAGALDQSRADWCLIDIVKVSPNGRKIQLSQIPDRDPFYAILKDDFIRRGMFFRRKAFLEVGMYHEQMKYREDWDLNVRIIIEQRPFIYLAKPLYFYFYREGSITTGNRARVLDFTQMLLRKHHKVLADRGDQRVAEIYAKNMWNLARNYFHDVHRFGCAIACAIESLRYDFSLGRICHPFLYHIRKAITSSKVEKNHKLDY